MSGKQLYHKEFMCAELENEPNNNGIIFNPTRKGSVCTVDTDYQIVNVEKPEETAWGVIGHGLQAYNVQQAGDERFKRICCALQAPDQTIVGGAIGELYWNWFHLDLLWLPEDLRGRGYGSQLLARIEGEARQHGAKYIFLDTFSFQAPEFYMKYGYTVFGELADFPPGHRRYFLTKSL